MSTTLQTQFRPFPSSGNTLTRDADPMSSCFGRDLLDGVNNLSYCSPYVGYVQTGGPNDHPAMIYDGSAASGESFLGQVPTILPRDGYRFHWALGCYHGVNAAEFGLSTYDHAVTISAINVYISPDPYTGTTDTGGGLTQHQDTLFDISKVSSPYGLSSYASPIHCTASIREYKFAALDTTSIGTWMPFDNPTFPNSPINKVWLILTFNRSSDDAAALTNETMWPQDFTWWVTRE